MPAVTAFLSTPSARRATRFQFFHRIRLGVFLSTPSARRATPRSARTEQALANFYPRPPRGGRPQGLPKPTHDLPISIHALREEGDLRCAGPAEAQTDFYPRPPRGGRPSTTSTSGAFTIFLSTPSARRATLSLVAKKQIPFLFLSTPSARRATISRQAGHIVIGYFYPRPPRGGRPAFLPSCSTMIFISIHALREEGDLRRFRFFMVGVVFLSTPSARRATGCAKTCCCTCWNFYPRPPRGGRPDNYLLLHSR